MLQILGWKVIYLDWNEVIDNAANEQWLSRKLVDANVDIQLGGVPTNLIKGLE